MTLNRTGSGPRRRSVRVGTAKRVTDALASSVGLGVLLAGCGGGSGSGLTGSARSHSEQVVLQSSIVSDRTHLFTGVLTYRPPDAMAVDATRQLTVTLTAVGRDSPPVSTADGAIVGSRSLRVGGREEAVLSARGGVDISAVGPVTGLIGQPGDHVNWTWDITPRQPGTHTLDLVVITYQGTTDNPLETLNPPVQISLRVGNTVSHTASKINGWVVGFGAFLAALAGIFVVITPLWRRRKSRR
jgi:hypothetical protein